ncbi:MAG: PilT/PilU family type 4a pilus ATPase [Gammaproteobacteria bacterium]|nr:PilT/PilU family type 4a pilus ATPase [Gammaproteobacteria bacterium]
MELNDYLKLMVAREASDLYLTVGAPASMRVNGQISPIEKAPMTPAWMRETAFGIMNAEQQKAFAKNPEMNVALGDDDIGRFRVNIFKQRGHIGMVIRCIKTEIPDAEVLGIPSIVKKLVMQKRGLILFVGATGSGKSTSLAALIDYRNTNSAGHIITIEDPIEYVHRHKKSIINQREVGDDTMTYAEALKNTLRQAPDVILIGEIRDRETMEHAIAFAETGHLAISTLHANNANQAVERIVNFFPEERHNQLFMDLSLNLKGVVSQRLIPSLDGKRVAAFEVLLGTPLISDLLLKGDIHKIKEVMERSENLGMKTFDSALYTLYKAGRISFEEALRNADSQNNLRLRISLEEKIDQDQSGLRLSEEESPPGTLGGGMFMR